MIRIAILTHGGVGPQGSTELIPALVNLVSRLSRLFDITVYSATGRANETSSFACGNAQVRYVDARYDDHIARIFLAFRQSLLSDHKELPFELLHGIWSYPSGLAAVILGKILHLPSFVTVFGGEAASVQRIRYGHMLKLPLRALTLWTCRKATALVTLTEFQRSLLKKHGLKRADIAVIPTGTTEAFSDLFKPKTLNLPIRFLHVANLTEVKDQITLLKAFRIISTNINARLRIIGPDYMNGKIQQTADQLGIAEHVTFLGYVHQEAILEHYAWAHMMLHTSLYEGQALVVNEAAASGVVVCGTRVGLIADLEDSCTIAVATGDHQGLAKKVLDLLNNPSQFVRLQTNAHTWAANHNLDWTVKRYTEVYQGCVQNKGTKADSETNDVQRQR